MTPSIIMIRSMNSYIYLLNDYINVDKEIFSTLLNHLQVPIEEYRYDHNNQETLDY